MLSRSVRMSSVMSWFPFSRLLKNVMIRLMTWFLPTINSECLGVSFVVLIRINSFHHEKNARRQLFYFCHHHKNENPAMMRQGFSALDGEINFVEHLLHEVVSWFVSVFDPIVHVFKIIKTSEGEIHPLQFVQSVTQIKAIFI